MLPPCSTTSNRSGSASPVVVPGEDSRSSNWGHQLPELGSDPSARRGALRAISSGRSPPNICVHIGV
jgi:hypothetical protein